MQGAVKRVHRVIGKSADGCVAVPEIVRAAEHYHNVRRGVHFLHAHVEIAVEQIFRNDFLPRDTRAAYAVIERHAAGKTREYVGVSVFYATCAYPFRDAVAQKSDRFPCYIHNCSFE